MKNINHSNYLDYFRHCYNVKSYNSVFEKNKSENFYKYISIYSNNDIIECPLIFNSNIYYHLEKNPILKLINFNDFKNVYYYKSLSKNLEILFFGKRVCTNEIIFTNENYSKFVKFESAEKNKYIFTKGIIFDSDYNIMCSVVRVHYRIDNLYNRDNYYFKIYINPKCYEIKDNVCKWIINEFYKNLILYINKHNQTVKTYNNHFEIEIKDPTDKFIIYPNEIIEPDKLEIANNGDFIKDFVDINQLSDYIVNCNNN